MMPCRCTTLLRPFDRYIQELFICLWKQEHSWHFNNSLAYCVGHGKSRWYYFGFALVMRCWELFMGSTKPLKMLLFPRLKKIALVPESTQAMTESCSESIISHKTKSQSCWNVYTAGFEFDSRPGLFSLGSRCRRVSWISCGSGMYEVSQQSPALGKDIPTVHAGYSSKVTKLPW